MDKLIFDQGFAIKKTEGKITEFDKGLQTLKKEFLILKN